MSEYSQRLETPVHALQVLLRWSREEKHFRGGNESCRHICRSELLDGLEGSNVCELDKDEKAALLRVRNYVRENLLAYGPLQLPVTECQLICAL